MNVTQGKAMLNSLLNIYDFLTWAWKVTAVTKQDCLQQCSAQRLWVVFPHFISWETSGISSVEIESASNVHSLH